MELQFVGGPSYFLLMSGILAVRINGHNIVGYFINIATLALIRLCSRVSQFRLLIMSDTLLVLWYRHLNSEAGNDEIQNFQRGDFYFVGITF